MCPLVCNRSGEVAVLSKGVRLLTLPSCFSFPLTQWGACPGLASTSASSSILLCAFFFFFKPLCSALIMESAVYVQGALKRRLTTP